DGCLRCSRGNSAFPCGWVFTSARIERAEFPVHRNRTLYRPCMAHPFGAQHDGPQQAVFGCGFVALTNALMRFPSIRGATASKSRQGGERKSLASSTL